jgi:hypothetical protein
MAEPDGVVDGRPAMRVDWNRVAYRNAVSSTRLIVFENQAVMLCGAAMTASSSGDRPGVHDSD